MALRASFTVAVPVALVGLRNALLGKRRICNRRHLLTLEGDYSLNTIRDRGLEHVVTVRDLDGFFEHVWSVNPFVGADPSEPEGSAFGPPLTTRIAPRHTFIEGKVGYRRALCRLPVLNFILAQSALIFRLSRLIRRERIGVIRASEPYYLGLMGLLLARMHHLPLVVRLIANYDADFWSGAAIYPRLFRWRSLEKRIGRYVLKRADLVAAGNEDIRHYALANGAREDRTTVFPVGHLIDPLHFLDEPGQRPDVRGELGLGDRPFVVCVSRLERVKHPEDVLVVLAEAKRRVPALAAVLVGDGSMRGELERKASELGVEEDVIFAGNRDQRWIARALASAAVVLSPLTGRALVEAALSGTAIVAYDVDWQSELVRSGETGSLVAFRDTRRMAEATCELLANEESAASLGKRARSVALETMDPGKLVRHEQAEYQKLLTVSGAVRGGEEGTGSAFRRVRRRARGRRSGFKSGP